MSMKSRFSKNNNWVSIRGSVFFGVISLVMHKGRF
jgi:hypothetical protein